MVRDITSPHHPLVKHLVRLRQNRDYREEHQSVLIEGTRLIGEVCPYYHTKLVMTYDPALIPPGVQADDTLLVNEQVMKKVSGVQTPEGIIAEIAMPPSHSLKGMHFILACDGISDPGNLGTLLRTCLALGWEGAFLLDNSCDPYNDKALRAAKGATFRLPIATGSWEVLQQLIEQNNLQPLAADTTGVSLSEVSSNQGILLVLNNEARGLSLEAQRHCQSITIPMPGPMESLNVAAAGAILMYTLRNNAII